MELLIAIEKHQHSQWFRLTISSSNCSDECIKLVVGSNQAGALQHMYIYIGNNQMREFTCLEETNYKDGQ